MFLHKLLFTFSVQQLGKQRVSFKHKICFKNSLDHLQLKTTPTLAITGRLFRDGKFLRIYKLFRTSVLAKVSNTAHQLPHNNEFKNLYYRYYSFRDLDRVLFWKIMAINSLFNIKKLSNKRIIYYLPKIRRQVIVLLWLKSVIKLAKKNYWNYTPELFNPLLKFIYTNRAVNEVYNLKLKIYKLRMMRG